jgi:hypothetical protein
MGFGELENAVSEFITVNANEQKKKELNMFLAEKSLAKKPQGIRKHCQLSNQAIFVGLQFISLALLIGGSPSSAVETLSKKLPTFVFGIQVGFHQFMIRKASFFSFSFSLFAHSFPANRTLIISYVNDLNLPKMKSMLVIIARTALVLVCFSSVDFYHLTIISSFW